MTNLANYEFDHASYLSANFTEFNSSKEYRFNTANPMLEIEAFCSVGILPSHSSTEVVVQIDADVEDLENFRVVQNGNNIGIKQINVGNGGVSTSGSFSISGGQNIQMINNRIYVNGVEVNNEQSSKTHRPAKIKILAPTGSSLEATIKGSGVLVSKVPFTSAELQIQGQGTVGLAAYELDCQVQGQGSTYLVAGGGDLDIDVSGQGSIKVQGTWSDAKVVLSGMGNIQTVGTCTGDYKASVSGMGEIRHCGSVSGRIKQSKSGMGSINIQQ